ncbi:MAG: outer membrane protein assembly factor BamA [Gemmatimonadota bacterium]|nr:outer membrane protein assembly factor BamA [Gemmatimonadota bacterium]
MSSKTDRRIGRPRKVGAFATTFLVVLTVWAPSGTAAQQGPGATTVDSVVVEGNRRVEARAITALFGVQEGQSITYRDIQRGIKALVETGQFRDVVVRARGSDATAPVTLVVEVEEQDVVRSIVMNGLESVSAGQVRDTTGLRTGAPLDRQRILDAKAFIRSELSERGIPFAQIEDRVEPVAGGPGEVDIIFDVTEGHRVTVADVRFEGNERLSDGELTGAMSTRPEGFWWFRSGQYDEVELQTDLEERLPSLYRSRGFLDFQVLSDTLVVDPETGKARLEVMIEEGPQYHLGSFEVDGNSRFATEEIRSFFRSEEGGVFQSLGIGGGDGNLTGEVFDAEEFNAAMQQLMEAYRNEGYLYVEVNPVLQRNPAGEDGVATVDASWEIREGEPAIVNRVGITGNEYTYEWVIRNQLSILPGDVYSQDRLIRSYQSISSLGFFEEPLPFPDIQPLENGDVDIMFNVQEKQTGSVNFGTSVGGGVGLSGFIGYEQPNLFGQAKSGSLRWDFGRYLNSFEMSYSDPALFQSRVSGSLSLFNSRDRFFQFSTGRRRRIGTNVSIGFPWPDSRDSRVSVGYGISRTKYELFSDVDDTSLFGLPPGVQSQLTLGVTRQTLDHPLFPTVGSRQNVNVELNGGVLGGDGDFTRILADGTWWVPAGRIGGDQTPNSGIRLALGLTLRGGAVLGNADAFPFDRFWMGGVQFGENLRGYPETAITPVGYVPEGARGVQDIERLGNAFFSLTAEYAVRLSGQVGLGAFFDAGNVWRSPGEIDPTRMFRGAGFGMQIVTPFGPIGLDYAYGFDRATPSGAPDPGWQFHFRMGPGF